MLLESTKATGSVVDPSAAMANNGVEDHVPTSGKAVSDVPLILTENIG